MSTHNYLRFSPPGSKGQYSGLLKESDKGDVLLSTFENKMARSYTFLEDASFTLPAVTSTTSSYATDKSHYLQVASRWIERMQKTALEKIVLSRILKYRGTMDREKAFQKLCDQYPDCLVFHFYTEELGEWIGATPELIIEKIGLNTFKTIALAGTKSSISEPRKWSAKEIEEQAIVVRDIMQRLDAHQIAHEIKPAEDKRLGNLIHLCSEITLRSELNIAEITKILHPTAAISGLPRDDAYSTIRREEGHARSVYCGIITLNMIDQPISYAPLRCARIHRDAADLYLGGGLTAESRPEMEWEETELKSRTILSVLEQ